MEYQTFKYRGNCLSAVVAEGQEFAPVFGSDCVLVDIIFALHSKQTGRGWIPCRNRTPSAPKWLGTKLLLGRYPAHKSSLIRDGNAIRYAELMQFIGSASTDVPAKLHFYSSWKSQVEIETIGPLEPIWTSGPNGKAVNKKLGSEKLFECKDSVISVIEHRRVIRGVTVCEVNVLELLSPEFEQLSLPI